MDNFITKILFLPPVVSAHGPQVDRLLFYVHALMFLLALGWGVFFFVTLWRFRQRRAAKADPVGVRSHVSSYLEVGVAGVEAFLLLAFAIPIWARGASPGNFPPEKEATVVRVIGRQFNWLFRYPGPDGVFGRGDAKLVSGQNPLGMDPDDVPGKDDIVVEGSEMVVPVNKPVIAHISSLDVIHSFAVKQLRVAQDAIPGMSNPVWFTPTKPGTYQITCAQLCGNGHSQMRGLLRVVEPAEFDDYLRGKSKTAGLPVSYE